jgi:enediyne biosynthesis protein E4
VDAGRDAGLDVMVVFGGREVNRYLLETTGTGVAMFDYDNDGLPDLFFVNGTTLEGFPAGSEPRPRLYRNRGGARFEDVTRAAGLHEQWGWGQGACTGDYDNDGHEDLLVTYYGQNRLFRNTGRGTFEDVTARAGLTQNRLRWNTGCAFLDYDRDGRLDIFVANYIDLDLATAPTPDSGLCRFKGLRVACGPPGLRGGTNILYRNLGGGRFEDVSERSGIANALGTYALGVATLDFDDDGWIDLYVANDSNPSALYRNRGDGTFDDIGLKAGCALSQDGKPQAGMGVGIGDFDRNGTMDIVKTNFAGDTSTLYANMGDGFCEDRTFEGGLGTNTRWLGWGAGFADFDNDGWLDIFLTNGHVYPEVRQLRGDTGYEQRKVVYRNVKGIFEDVSERLGPPVTTPKAGRGTAFGDIDNDGTIDVVVSNVHDTPDLFLTRAPAEHRWLLLKLVGTASNRSAIGARVRVTAGGATQVHEVRGGGSYLSQSDLRVHVGLGTAARVDRLEIRWPNGLEEAWSDIAANRVHVLTEGTGRALGGTK